MAVNVAEITRIAVLLDERTTALEAAEDQVLEARAQLADAQRRLTEVEARRNECLSKVKGARADLDRATTSPAMRMAVVSSAVA